MLMTTTVSAQYKYPGRGLNDTTCAADQPPPPPENKPGSLVVYRHGRGKVL